MITEIRSPLLSRGTPFQFLTRNKNSRSRREEITEIKFLIIKFVSRHLTMVSTKENFRANGVIWVNPVFRNQVNEILVRNELSSSDKLY